MEKSEKLIAEVHSSGTHVQIIGYTLLTWIKIKPFGASSWKNQHILMACIGDVKAGKLSPCGSSTPQARD